MKRIILILHDFGAKLRVRIAALRQHRPHWLHDGHEWAHLAYFGAVFIEGHGIYATMGGVLLAIGLALIFFHEGEI